MTGWVGSIREAVRVCGFSLSAAKLLLMVGYNFSDPRRHYRPRIIRWLLGLLGAPAPVRLRLRVPRCTVWMRPFDAGDVQSFKEVFVTRCYPVPEGDTVIDAGANIGFFSTFAALEGTIHQIVAVEPDPSNVELLRRNTADCGVPVTVVQAALWSEEGTMLFLPAGQSNTGCLAAVAETESTPRPGLTVRTIRPTSSELPKPEEIDYLKLDIEGAEVAVLPEYVQKLSPGAVLVGELHGVDTISRMRPMLERGWIVLKHDATTILFKWTR